MSPTSAHVAGPMGQLKAFLRCEPEAFCRGHLLAVERFLLVLPDLAHLVEVVVAKALEAVRVDADVGLLVLVAAVLAEATAGADGVAGCLRPQRLDHEADAGVAEGTPLRLITRPGSCSSRMKKTCRSLQAPAGSFVMRNPITLWECRWHSMSPFSRTIRQDWASALDLQRLQRLDRPLGVPNVGDAFTQLDEVPLDANERRERVKASTADVVVLCALRAPRFQ